MTQREDIEAEVARLRAEASWRREMSEAENISGLYKLELSILARGYDRRATRLEAELAQMEPSDDRA